MYFKRLNVRLLGVTAVASALFMAASSPTRATTATSNLSVTATVTANCTIGTSPVAFGSYDPVVANATSPLNGTGTITVTCTTGSAATITLGQGSDAASGSTDAAPLRQMKDSGTDVLAYTLYQDSGRTTVWGNTAGTGVAETGTGAGQNVTVYGAVTAGQNVPAGSYSDTVVATVTF
jgi:spore coat protein U-like protein